MIDKRYLFCVVFVKPVRGLLREVLDYLIEDDDATHIDRWLNKLKEYMAVKPVLE